MHAIINAALPTTYLSASVFYLRSVYTFQRIRFFCPWQFLLSWKTDTFIRPTYFFCFMWEAGGMAYFCSSFPRDLQGKACFVHAGSAIFFGWRCLFCGKPTPLIWPCTGCDVRLILETKLSTMNKNPGAFMMQVCEWLGAWIPWMQF